MDWIEVNGTALRYDLAGEGRRTIVLLHEMGGSLNSWDAMMPLLTPTHRVLRLDWRGFGMSAKLRGIADMDALAEDVRALLDGLSITDKVAVVGCAVGAGIAIRFASRHPDRIGALIPMSPVTNTPPERHAQMFTHAERMEREGLAGLVEASLAASYPEDLRTDAARFATHRARWLTSDPASFAAIYRMLPGLNYAADFPAITCPTLVIGAVRDLLRPPETAEAVAKQINGARFKVLHTGHFSMVQTPELIAGTILPFLAEVGMG
jgi:pimeloyl-ACP methyl ester carboxylesterase